MFPKNGEVLSFTGFINTFKIQLTKLQLLLLQNDISWVNSGDKAVGLGIEGEWRKTSFQLKTTQLAKKLI